MPKSEKQFSHEGTKAQGNKRLKFILLIIIAATILLYHLNVTVSQPSESADRLVTADSTFKHTPAKMDSKNDLSDGCSSLSPDRSILDHPDEIAAASHRAGTGADYPDTMDLLDSIVEKLWQLESSGRLNPPDGDGGDAVGPLQLHLGVLKDVNKYFDFNFVPDDRKDLTKSKFIAKAYITMWIMENNEEIGVRIFNGGPRGWRSETTDNYWNKYKDLKFKIED